ncbi:MAG: hypothetical protein WD689_00950 [Gaiellaceae bacterium]
MGRPLLFVVALLVLAPPVAVYAGSGAALDGTLYATVGPGYTISLENAAGAAVTQLDPGTYAIEIDDRSSDHNFHLVGPGGVSAGTEIGFVGKRTVTVTLGNGQYTYVCDDHSYDMLGQFAVGTGSSTPPPTTTPQNKLAGTVGPGFTITLTKGGRRFTSLKAGIYSIVVNDRSSAHNFHLLGPGVNKLTGVAFVGRQTWRVRLRPGLHTFRCDPHRTSLRGTFRVRA